MKLRLCYIIILVFIPKQIKYYKMYDTNSTYQTGHSIVYQLTNEFFFIQVNGSVLIPSKVPTLSHCINTIIGKRSIMWSVIISVSLY